MTEHMQKALAARIQAYRDRLAAAGVSMPGFNQEDEAPPQTTTEVEGQKGGAVTVRVQGPFDDWFGFDVRALIREMDEMEPTSIEMLIESPGGFLDDGMALFNDLRSRARDGVEITTEARGLVASAAVLPFVAGEDRRMSTGTSLMIHDPWNYLFAMGDSREIRAQVDRYLNGLEAGERTLRDIFVDRTGNDRDQLDEWLGTDTYFGPQDAVDNGFATEVVDAGEPEADEQARAMAASVLTRWRLNQLEREATP